MSQGGSNYGPFISSIPCHLHAYVSFPSTASITKPILYLGEFYAIQSQPHRLRMRLTPQNRGRGSSDNRHKITICLAFIVAKMNRRGDAAETKTASCWKKIELRSEPRVN